MAPQARACTRLQTSKLAGTRHKGMIKKERQAEGREKNLKATSTPNASLTKKNPDRRSYR
jgi:hypothetical protein